MLDAAFWGLIQGLTEFLPISSSGHLVLVPAMLDREGPDLAVSAVLHLGTLAAVLVYFRTEVAGVIRFTDDGRRLLRMMVIGTVPAAVIGIAIRSQLDSFNETPRAVAGALFAAGIILVLVSRRRPGQATAEDVTERDAGLIGFGQALALIPGVTRSGMAIGVGVMRSLSLHEAARFAFLLGIPAIAGAGLFEFIDLAGEDKGVESEVWVGVGVAAVVGYGAISLFLRVIRTAGLKPFGIYCVVAGLVAFLLV